MTEQSLAAGGGEGAGQGQDGAGAAGSAGTTSNPFVESLPQDLRGHESLKSYQDAGALAKDFINLQGKIPKVPESHEAYEVEYPEGFPKHLMLGENFTKGFHAAGLTQEQVKGLTDLHVKMVQDRMMKINKAQDEAIKGLKEDWKEDYDKNLQLVNKVVVFAGGDELTKLVNTQVDGKRLGDHPVFLKAMHKIGSMLSEDELVVGEPHKKDTLQMTPGGRPIFKSYDQMGQKK